MRQCIDHTFASWGVKSRNVKIELIKNGIAYTSEINLFDIHAGSIRLNPHILKFFSYEEICFILAHECAHIFQNHVLAGALYEGLENAASNLQKV